MTLPEQITGTDELERGAIGQKQIRFITRHNKTKAQYRSKLVNGEWDKYWFHLTIGEARILLAEGKAEEQDCSAPW